MNLIAILSNIRLPDILDILFISFVAYQFFAWFWGTKAFKALIGIIVLSGIFIVAKAWGLFLTTWVFQILWQVFVILLIILFQKEIRQMLEKFNPLKTMGLRQNPEDEAWVSPFARWAFDAAHKRIGALVVFERSDLVFDQITKGIAIESEPLPEVLNSIFYKESPLHDGAILISNGKVLKASCFLPLSTMEDLPQEWGTRHRASLGLTEQTDAWVMIVSEERGEVSFAQGQKIEKIKDQETLVKLLRESVLSFRAPSIGIKEKLLSWVKHRIKVKAAVFGIVCVTWLAFAGQQNFEKRIDLPVTFRNIPANLEMVDPVDRTVSVTFRGLRKDISLLSQSNVTAQVKVVSDTPGTTFYTLHEQNLTLPNDRIVVARIMPSRIILTLEKIAPEPSESVPVNRP